MTKRIAQHRGIEPSSVWGLLPAWIVIWAVWYWIRGLGRRLNVVLTPLVINMSLRGVTGSAGIGHLRIRNLRIFSPAIAGLLRLVDNFFGAMVRCFVH